MTTTVTVKVGDQADWNVQVFAIDLTDFLKPDQFSKVTLIGTVTPGTEQDFHAFGGRQIVVREVAR